MSQGIPQTPGRFVDLASFDRPSLSETGFTGVELRLVEGVGVSDVKNVTLEEALSWLREGLSRPADYRGVLEGDAGERPAYLDVAITELNPGSTVARFWAGEFGAGHAWVQVEALLRTEPGGSVVGRLVQRTRISGVASFQNSRGRDSGPVLLRQILFKAGVAIQRELAVALAVPGSPF